MAEILSPLTLLVNAMGIEMGWRVTEGRPEFFAFTKELHNGLQGTPVEITENKRRAYEQIVFENSLRMHLEHDVCKCVVRTWMLAGAWVEKPAFGEWINYSLSSSPVGGVSTMPDISVESSSSSSAE